MDISCPNCTASYRVPDTLVAARRPLRCAACGHSWVPEAPAAAPAAAPVAAPPARVAPPAPPPAPVAPAPVAGAPQPAADPPPAESPPIPTPIIEPRPQLASAEARARRLQPLPLAWAASVAAVAGLVIGLALYRAELAALWPPFQRVANLLGG
jgi:predicted Zn finger-like uncharacterized protein